MWLLTPIGFFSIVQKRDDATTNTLTIRARVKDDLDALRLHYLPSLGPVIANAGTDYRYRAQAPRADISQVMSKLITDIKYDNFKNEVCKRQGKKRANAYHKVWDALFDITEPEVMDTTYQQNSTKKQLVQAYGGVLMDEQHRVLLVKPHNEFDGYVWTFPKGRPNADELTEQTALREVLEETGYTATITQRLPGHFAGGTTVTDYFLMSPIGEPKPFGWEAEAVSWVTLDEAEEMILITRNAVGRKRDLSVLREASLVRAVALSQIQTADIEKRVETDFGLNSEGAL